MLYFILIVINFVWTCSWNQWFGSK